MRELLTYIERHADVLTTTIETLVRLESPSTDKAAVDRCGETLAEMLRATGGDVGRLPRPERGDHIRARFAGSGAPILILGHFDTVWPIGTLDRMPLRHADGKLFGPGTFDMKGGIALAIAAMQALRATATAHPAVTLLWTTDEEIGSESS